jgi:hypothetical protein
MTRFATVGDDDEGDLVPWGERPAFVVLGHSEQMRVPPRTLPPSEAPVAFVERVIIANGRYRVGLPPAALVTMRRKAEADGWTCRELWGLAEVVVRTLTPIEGSESKRFVESLVEMASVSLRLARGGQRAYALWTIPRAALVEQRKVDILKPAKGWTYAGGGLQDASGATHGVKVTALRSALSNPPVDLDAKEVTV